MYVCECWNLTRICCYKGVSAKVLQQFTQECLLILFSILSNIFSHLNKRTTYTDPRLAFAVEESNNPQDFNQRFDAFSTALGVLQGRDLSGKYAIITGANSGIGLSANWKRKPENLGVVSLLFTAVLILLQNFTIFFSFPFWIEADKKVSYWFATYYYDIVSKKRAIHSANLCKFQEGT